MIFLFALIASPVVLALDPALEISQYAHTAWSTQAGSLKSGVRAIAQTPDGYLWLGTEFGLLRFDGVRFVPWNPPPRQHLPSTNIRSLLVAREGTFWIGTLEGLVSWQAGRISEYVEFAHQNVLTLLEDREGTVWAGTFGVPNGKLCSIKRRVVQCYGSDGSLGQWVWSLYEDADGQVWAGAQTGLWRWRPGPPKSYSMPHPLETAQGLVDDDDRTGLLAVAETIWRFGGGKIQPYRVATPPGRLTPTSVFRDDDHGLWIGTLQQGLLHVHGTGTSLFAQQDGLSGNHVLTLFEDRERNIWVGTTDGLDRFHETSVSSISTKQGLSNPSVSAVLVARDNSVWLSTLDGLNRWQDGRVTIYWPARGAKNGPRHSSTQQSSSAYYSDRSAVTEIWDPGMPDTTVGSLYEDISGRLWVTTPKGVTRFENGRFSVVREVPAGWVNALTGDLGLGIWISYQDLGLVHWSNGQAVETIPWSRLGGNVTASSLVPDPVRGGLWLGFFQGGLVHFKDGKIRKTYGQNEGLGGGRVMDLRLAADGALWAATEGGLSRITDEGVVTLKSSNGLPCDTVHWAAQVNGSYWLYTACGLLGIDVSELQRWIADPARSIRFKTLDRSDGVRSRALLAGYTPRVSQSAQGRLWFIDLERVSVFDPQHLFMNNVIPPVHIERVVADDVVYAPATALHLPPRVRNLSFDFVGLSLVAAEKNQYRFRLQGWDPDWREATNEFHVEYTNLPPKHYRFHVIASNNSGVWNDRGDAVDFTIAPAYWQTNWFRALCVAAVAAVIWMLYRLRMRHLAHEFDLKLESRVDERTRIARELHDTLLQSFNAALVRFRTAHRLLLDRPDEGREVLESAIDDAREALSEGRQAVQGLRSSVIETNELSEAIRKLAEELASEPAHAGGAEVRLNIEGTPRALRPLIRDDIYRLVGEALRNAFRHAQASHIEVQLVYDARRFELRVRDDGKGIDPKHLREGGLPGHFGLPGMRERAQRIGGKFSVWSAPDSGTEIALSIPAARAYGTGKARASRLGHVFRAQR